MKIFLSISFSILILLSGMHLSKATHICGGEVAAVKWSFSGEKATCGMENSKHSCPVHNGIDANCCQNKISIYTVDNNYNLSSFPFKEVTKSLFQIFYIPESISFHSSTSATSLDTINNPPGNSLARAVSLSDICIFRI